MPQSILMIIPTFYPVVGGTQTQVLNLSKRMLADGWGVKVVTRQHSVYHPYGLPKHEIVDGIQVQRIYSRGGKLGSVLFLLGGLLHLSQHERRQIYYAHDTGVAGWMAIIARLLWGGCAIVKLRTGRMSYESINTGKLARWQFSLLLRLVDVVHVVSQEGEQIAREVGVRPEQIVLIPNSVDTVFFSPVKPDKKKCLRQELCLPADKTVVLYVGRFEHIKGVDVLLDAWECLPGDIRDRASLMLIGDGFEHEMLRNTIAAKKMAASVSVLGIKKNVRDYYRAADVLVLPSRTEGLSNSMVEAMACGMPVIASNVGGARDFIHNKKNGFIFEPENVTQLTQQLISIISCNVQLTEVAMAARDAIVERASLDKSVNCLCASFENALHVKP